MAKDDKALIVAGGLAALLGLSALAMARKDVKIKKIEVPNERIVGQEIIVDVTVDNVSDKALQILLHAEYDNMMVGHENREIEPKSSLIIPIKLVVSHDTKALFTEISIIKDSEEHLADKSSLLIIPTQEAQIKAKIIELAVI